MIKPKYLLHLSEYRIISQFGLSWKKPLYVLKKVVNHEEYISIRKKLANSDSSVFSHLKNLEDTNVNNNDFVSDITRHLNNNIVFNIKISQL